MQYCRTVAAASFSKPGDVLVPLPPLPLSAWSIYLLAYTCWNPRRLLSHGGRGEGREKERERKSKRENLEDGGRGG